MWCWGRKIKLREIQAVKAICPDSGRCSVSPELSAEEDAEEDEEGDDEEGSEEGSSDEFSDSIEDDGVKVTARSLASAQVNVTMLCH